MRTSMRAFVAVADDSGVTSAETGLIGQARTIGAFFDDFSAEWMRRRPSQSTASRYFTGAEQDRLDRQLTPETPEWRRETVEQARRGLKELATLRPVAHDRRRARVGRRHAVATADHRRRRAVQRLRLSPRSVRRRQRAHTESADGRASGPHRRAMRATTWPGCARWTIAWPKPAKRPRDSRPRAFARHASSCARRSRRCSNSSAHRPARTHSSRRSSSG